MGLDGPNSQHSGRAQIRKNTSAYYNGVSFNNNNNRGGPCLSFLHIQSSTRLFNSYDWTHSSLLIVCLIDDLSGQSIGMDRITDL